jgi:hypothetical protein
MEPLKGPHETLLRQALEPAPETVARVVSQALAAPRPAPALRLLPAAPLIAALLLAAVLLVRPLPQRAGGVAGAAAATSIETVGDMLVVRSREGRISIVGSGPEPDSRQGTLIVIYGGGQ